MIKELEIKHNNVCINGKKVEILEPKTHRDETEYLKWGMNNNIPYRDAVIILDLFDKIAPKYNFDGGPEMAMSTAFEKYEEIMEQKNQEKYEKSTRKVKKNDENNYTGQKNSDESTRKVRRNMKKINKDQDVKRAITKEEKEKGDAIFNQEYDEFLNEITIMEILRERKKKIIELRRRGYKDYKICNLFYTAYGIEVTSEDLDEALKPKRQRKKKEESNSTTKEENDSLAVEEHHSMTKEENNSTMKEEEEQ